MRYLAMVVWKGASICYNPAKIPEDAAWDLADTFIHGALFGPGGTCATLPIIYTAIGRRLGYPLKLVAAWGPKWDHLFCRWEGQGERFNVEINATGVSFPADNHYRRHRLDPVRERAGRFLQSKTPREELAYFLAERGHCWQDCGNLRQCVESLAWAAGLCPTNRFYLETLKGRYNNWLREVKQRQPPGFPEIYLKVVARRYPEGLPLQLEQDIICLETTADLLRDPEADGRWWSPLRQGSWGTKVPSAVLVDSMPDGLKYWFRFPAYN